MAITKVKTLGITDANVTAAKLATDSVETAKITAANVTNAKLGTDISAAKLTAGTVPDARFPATLPAASGANLTNLNATNLGSGTVPTARLGTGTADSSVFLAGNNTWASAGGGKIGQVLQTVKTDRSTYGTAAWADISGMSVTITPSATTSKILVMTDAFISVTSNYGAHIKLLRDSTDIYVGDAAGSRSQASKGAVYYHGASGFSMAFHYLDSPSTTSATTYKLQWYPENTATIAIGGTQSDGDAVYNSRTANSITVMEVLA